MALTSSIYRMAPNLAGYTREELERHLRMTLRRLLERHGQETVVRRIQAWPGDESLKTSLILTVYVLQKRLSGTI